MNKTLFPRRFIALVLFLVATICAPAAIDRNYKTTPVMSDETRTLVKMLEYIHYNKDAVSSVDYPQMITDYMSDLDPQRLLFTAQDEQNFRKEFGPRLEQNLAYLGNIDPSFTIFRVYEQRAQERADWIFDELKRDFDFTTKETYTPDRSKSPWPATPAEADNLWRHRLKFELLQEIIGSKPAVDKTVASTSLPLESKTPDAGQTISPPNKLDDAKQTIRKRYERMLKNIADIEASELEEIYLSSLTHLFDPHSDYMSADTLDEFSIQMKLSLVGIGAVLGLDDDGTCIIREVVPGGPADLSGLIKPNDKIITVTQTGGEPIEVIGMKLRRIVEQIRGAKGSKVHLTIIPHDASDSSQRKEVTLVRDTVKLNSARASALIYELPAGDQQKTHVGVISLNSFYGPSDDASDGTPQSTATQDVAELIGKLRKENIQALVIDLRRNGGGLLNESISLAGLFIGRGEVVQVRSPDDRKEVFSSDQAGVAWDGPLAVLTSRFSASSSEIFAGALQNYGRAIVVGDSSTHGKGTVQAVLDMKNYMPARRREAARTGAAKLTVQKFYLPNGASTQQKGVIPDLTLPSIDDFLPVGESSLPRALVWDEIRPAPNFAGKPLAESFLLPLQQASLARQNTLEEFSFLKQNIEWFKTKQEQKSVSLNLEERQRQKQLDDAFKKQMDAERERLAAIDFASHEIKLDAVEKIDATSKKPEPTAPAGDTDSAGAPDEAKFDIHLRETLRIITDALKLSKDPQYWADGRPPITYAANSGKG